MGVNYWKRGNNGVLLEEEVVNENEGNIIKYQVFQDNNCIKFIAYGAGGFRHKAIELLGLEYDFKKRDYKSNGAELTITPPGCKHTGIMTFKNKETYEKYENRLKDYFEGHRIT